MKNRDPNDRLLGDIFADALSPDFRANLLASTLQTVQRKRRMRKTVRVAAAVMGIVCLIGLSTWSLRRSDSTLVSLETAPVTVVRTQPLPRSSIVTTQGFATEAIIQTVAFTQLVHTEKEHSPFRIIGDRELLALVGEGRAALVRVGPETEELIFVNPNDANGFLLR